MSRFNDQTIGWFKQGQEPDTLAALPEEEPAPKRSPMLIAVAVSASLVGAGVMWAVGHHEVPLPPKLAAQIPVHHTTPDVQVAPVAAASTPVVAPAPVESSPVAAPVAVAASQPATPVVAAAAPVASRPVVAAAPSRPQRSGRARASVAPKSQPARPSRVAAAPQVIAGEKLLKQQHYAAALDQFQKLLVHQPNDVRALRGACTALHSLGRASDAARVCRRALSLAPEDLETRRALATIYFTGGAYQWSANEWRRILADHPNDPTARKGLRAAEARL